jgi:hypothetical protein
LNVSVRAAETFECFREHQTLRSCVSVARRSQGLKMCVCWGGEEEEGRRFDPDSFYPLKAANGHHNHRLNYSRRMGVFALLVADL